jgi:hypothetical protein
MTKGLASTIVKIIPEADLKILKKYLKPKYINTLRLMDQSQWSGSKASAW